MCDHLSIYEEFFGVKEGELLSFSFPVFRTQQPTPTERYVRHRFWV